MPFKKSTKVKTAAKAGKSNLSTQAKQYNAEMSKLTEDAKKAQGVSDAAYKKVLEAKDRLVGNKTELDAASVEYEQARQALAIANKAVTEFHENYVRNNQQKVSQ